MRVTVHDARRGFVSALDGRRTGTKRFRNASYATSSTSLVVHPALCALLHVRSAVTMTCVRPIPVVVVVIDRAMHVVVAPVGPHRTQAGAPGGVVKPGPNRPPSSVTPTPPPRSVTRYAPSAGPRKC